MKILYVGYSGYPYGLAQVQRQHLIAKGLVELGNKVLVVSRKGMHDSTKLDSIKCSGNFEGVDYLYCSGTPYRPDSFLKRNFLKLEGLLVEFVTIIRNTRDKNTTIFITSNFFTGILYYSFLAKIFGVSSIVDQVEYWSAHESSFINKIGRYFNDNFYFYFPTKVIVISDFLLARIKMKTNKVQVIKVPALCDFEKFDNCKSTVPTTPFFLFCGSAMYSEVIHFIIDSYDILKTNVDLVIVASGDSFSINAINMYIQSNNINGVVIKSNIPYKELLELYKSCLSLLIPLRPTHQDIARFPHKLGEYTASKKPIISTKIGEVNIYFKDGLNALLCDNFNVIEYSAKMQEVIDNVELSEKISNESYLTGLHEFDYKKNAHKIYNFILQK